MIGFHIRRGINNDCSITKNELKCLEKAETIPWDAIEEKYAKLFPSKTGMPAKPLRMALGSLWIQKQLGFSGREMIIEHNISDDPPPGGGSYPDTARTDTTETKGTRRGKSWRPSFTASANLMTCCCEDGTGGVPEKTTLPTPKAENTAQRRYRRHSISSLVTLEGIAGPNLGRPGVNTKTNKKQEY